MFSTMLICVGLLSVASGAIAIVLHRSVAVLASRVLSRGSVPIARVLQDGPVRIDGTVAASDHVALVAPCSGKPAVWFRLRLRNFTAGGSRRGVWLTVFDEQCGTTFRVLDGSGEYAQIDMNAVHVMTSAADFHELPLEAHDRVRLFLEGRGSEFWVADAYEEECLRPGDRVLAAR
jgi:hypothetical protein